MRIHVHAFTLFELIVVVGIMVMLSSMIFIPFSSTAKQAVSESALELQSVLIRARSLALKTGKMHAVSFHIENAGDGSVLRNRFPDDETGDALN